MQHRTPALLLLGSALLAACGGSSSDPNTVISGISGPNAVSIVTPDESNVSTGGGGGGPSANSWPVGSDYLTDAANVRVYDPSMESLAQGNQILCMLSLTAYDEMVNTPPYVAQVDEDLCQEEQGGGSENQSSAVSQNLLFFTVDADRASDAAPQINKMWIPTNANGGPTLINARMVVEEGPSQTNPFGTFEANWAGVGVGETLMMPGFYGVLRSDDLASPGFEFYENMGDVNVAHAPGDFSREVQVHVSLDPGSDRGVARMNIDQRYNFGAGDSGLLSSSWRIAFNDSHLKRQLGTGPITTLSRTDFTDNVHRYNLYHAEGAQLGERVELESGFGFQTGGGEYGWIGYYGMWVPQGVAVNHGDTITRQSPNGQSGATYTVQRSPGRLVEFSRNTLALTNLAGQVFEWWDSGNRYRVDYSVSDFRRVAVWNNGTESWDAITPPTVIDVNAAGGYLNMWSQTLGGPVSYTAGDSSVTYFAEEFVELGHGLLAGASGGQVQLFGLVECLRSGITSSEANMGDIYLADAPNPSTPHSYRLGESDLTLRHDPNGDGSVLNVVGLGSGQEPTSGPNTWGMRSGPLVTSTTGLTNNWDIWNVSTFYVYETGHNEWNQRVALLDSMSAPVIFDKPIEFLYQHSTANDINDDPTYDGQSYFLSYNGPGRVHGIPYDPVDLDGDSEPDRWFPRFGIADGVVMGPTGTEFAIRAIEVEQTMNEDPGAAPTLDVTAAGGLALPDGSEYVTPDIGTRPTVTGPPAVIDGVVQ